eukprot:CAMPEP_0172209014 /NCGR_PEP_ID=MMETSP1050-20130122/34846_1 /TAXON_ID=233186 /ORGANISM="Cryptomonas curvata, Strain CCAP979/52" /LENGTH=340 /DNA_ID=CAMNT_0012888777 /DNA_START=390 /DNA_END=1415 /DNA_ORIENTATION=+
MAASPALSTSSRVLTEPKNQEELEDALRQVLLKISVSDSLLPPQKRKDVRKITQQAAVVFPRRPTALNITYIFLKCSVSPIWHQCPARTAPYSHTRFRRRITADQKPLAVGAGNIQLYVHTAEHRYAVDNDWETVEEDDAPAAGDDGGRLRGAADDSAGALVPLKSVRAGPMHVQLLQSSDRRFAFPQCIQPLRIAPCSVSQSGEAIKQQRQANASGDAVLILRRMALGADEGGDEATAKAVRFRKQAANGAEGDKWAGRAAVSCCGSASVVAEARQLLRKHVWCFIPRLSDGGRQVATHVAFAFARWSLSSQAQSESGKRILAWPNRSGRCASIRHTPK